MKLVTYANGDQTGVGVCRDGDDGVETVFTGYADMLDLIADGERGLDRARTAAAKGRPVRYDKLLAPIPRPGTIFGCGVNYASHGDEEPGFVFPDEPVVDFIKLPSAVIGPGDDIVIPPHTGLINRPGGFQVDYEVELGVVIGRTVRGVAAADALSAVFGYTLFNDVGARAVQFKNRQADLAKNFDTFAPMGPCIVTADAITDPATTHYQAVVNGQVRQEARGSDMIYSVSELIEWISSIITLRPGDCISTGTPAGCGTFADPPTFLAPGDVVTLREDTIGELTNRVVAG